LDKKWEKRPKKNRYKPRPETTEIKGPKSEGGTIGQTEEGLKIKWSAFPIPGPLTKPGAGETVYDGPPDPAMLEAEGLLREIIQRLGLNADIKTSRIGSRIVLELQSLDNYLLIGRKGASLNALELIINRVTRQKNRVGDKLSCPKESDSPAEELADARRELLAQAAADQDLTLETDKLDDPGDDNPQIVVDAENYRARRYQGILEKAAFMADKVLKTNKPQVLTQLSSPERRLVHMAIESVPGLTTRSYGFGLIRNLTILPKKYKSSESEAKKTTPPPKTTSLQGSDSLDGEALGEDPKAEDPLGLDLKGGEPLGVDSKDVDLKGGAALSEDPLSEDPLGEASLGADPKGADPLGEASLGADPKNEVPLGEDSLGANPKGAEPKGEDPKSAEPKGEDPKSAEPKGEDPKSAEPKGEDPKSAEPKGEDPKSAEPKSEDSNSADLKDEDPLGADLKDEDPLGADLKDEDPLGGEALEVDSKGEEQLGGEALGEDAKSEDKLGEDQKGEEL
jgi:predicted RNA-binding protein Jag